MKLGEIYKADWDNSIMRIIGFDELEVLYDAYSEHDDSWIFASNIKKKCSFYRTSREVFKNKTKLIDFKELTQEELNIFRPDLPIRTCRVQNISWTANFEAETLDNEKFTIKTDKIWLYPIGVKGGLKKGELVTAQNKKEFTNIDLIMLGSRIQQNINPNKTNGIGIFRIGIQKQIPSYYIGEYYDLAGITK